MKNKPYSRNYIFTLLIIFGALHGLSAQRNETNDISKFTTEHGLSCNVVYSILQDKKGLIWVATEEGLNKFDGKNFTLFAVNKGRYGLSHNRAQAMYLAPDGNIWVGTSDGLNIYDYKSDRIIQVRNNTSPLKLVYNDITYLTSSSDKNKTWIGTYGNGVNYFDWTTKRFYAVALPKIPNAVQPLNVVSLMEDDNKRLWIGTRHNGLYRYDLENKRLEYYPLPDNSLFIRTIYQDSFRRIWVGTSHGCYLYNETTNRLDLINYPSGLNKTSIGVIKEDHTGKLWIGSELFLLNFSVRAVSLNQQFAYQMISSGESSSRLNCSSVNALFADQDNNMWIGTAWGGVNMLKGTSTKFKLVKHEPDSRNTLPNSPITGICYDRKGNLLISTMGTDKIGLCQMNLQTDEIKEMAVNSRLPGAIYQSILLDSKNNLWLGTYNMGLLKVDNNGSAYRQFTFDKKDPNSIPGNDIRTICESRDETIWIGTSNGIAKWDYKTNKLTRVVILNNTLGIRCIKEAPDGTLWIGTYGAGVVTYQPKTGKTNLKPTNLIQKIIVDILFDKDDVWLATQGEGLILYNRKTKQNSVFTENEGLSSNYVRALAKDSKGRIWMSTTKGISRLDAKHIEIENFSSQDGVQSREFNDRAVVTLPDGRMVFSGFGGLNIFNPLNVNKNDKCPSVVFTKLLVFNELATPSDDNTHSPLKENISLAEKIELKHDQSVFTIEFMGINYNANQKIQYAYFLEGSDKKWNHLGNQNNVTFRNLASGTYVFKVKASSPDAVWNEDKVASIIIKVRPPFWATGWAYLLYILILAAILYFVWSFITIRIRTANRLKIERAKREKDEELHQEKLQFFTNISHEFRTPLTLIISPLEKMHQDENEEEKKLHLQLMLRNAKRLLTMVNQLLDFRKAERGQMKLRVQKLDMTIAIKDILLSFEELRLQKNIHFEFIHNQESITGWFDLEFLNKSLFNLLSNAYKFTPDYGSITISASVKKDAMENNVAEITLTDNGKGILPKDIPNIFERFYQGKEQSSMQKGSGIGLHLTRSLIELHHGTIEVKSKPNVETSFQITLPIEKSAYLTEEFMDISDMPSSDTQPELEVDSFNSNKKSIDTQKRESKKRILVVEDNQDIRSYIHSILGADYIIEEAENGIIGLEMVALHEFDLIISDLMMPEMDGMEMCKQLKSSIETDHIPIILLTAKSDIENRIEGLSVGAESYITKPFHPQHLIIRVSKLIELREMLKERYSRKISLGDLQKPDMKSASPDELFMQKTISIILAKMIESEFNGDSLAYELSISRMGLHRKIKALTGQSTGEFIRNIRLKKACELLSSPGRNISEVCYDVGFNSPSYFTTCFTEAFKMTPSEYAKAAKNSNIEL